MLAARLLAALVAALIVGGLGPVTSPARADALEPPALGQPAADSVTQENPVFTWAGVPRAGRYRIQVSTSQTFDAITYTAEVHGTTATPTTELPLGQLHWRVATLDAAKAPGPYSEPRSFRRDPAGAPQPLTPAAGATLAYPDDPAVLSWEPVAGIAEYRVQIDDESSFTGASEYTTDNTSFALPAALPSNAARYWRVQGISTNPAVTTAWSDATGTRSFAIAWPAATKPALLAPADDAVTKRDDVAFSWTPVPGAAKYEFQLSRDETFTTVDVAQVTGATRFRPTSVMTQDEYHWRVRALQANGEPTSWSDVWALDREWLDGDGLPARPAVTIPDADGLSAGTQLELDGIAFSWTPVRGAAYYEVDVSTGPAFQDNATRTCKTPHTAWTPYLTGTYTETGGGFGACAWVGTATSALQTRFMNEGGTYWVRVRAVDQTPSGQTRTSLYSNAAREGEGAPPAPASFTVTPRSGPFTDGTQPAVPVSSPDGADTPKLTWEPVDGAVAYEVHLARDSSFNTRVLSTPVVTTNTELVLNQVLLDSSVGQSYFWYVLPCTRWDGAGDVDNNCPVGDEQAINIPGRFLSFNKRSKPVEGLSAESVQTDTVALSWQDQLTTSPGGGGVKWYELEVRNASNVVVDAVKTDATGHTPIDKSYPDGQYTWSVRAVDAAGTLLAASAPGSFEKRSSVPVPAAPAPSTALPVLRWSPTAFAGSYDVEIFRGTDPAFPSGNRVQSATQRRYPVWAPTDALPADTYSWRVRQVDAYNRQGPWSTQVMPFTIGQTKPVLVSPQAGAGVSLPDLVFDWDPVPGAVRYRFEASLSPSFATTVESVSTTGTVYAPVATYAGGTTYHWRVSALNAAGDTLATSDARTFTATTVPAAPGTVKATVVGATIEVSWAKPATGGSEITGYVVRYRESGTSEWTELPEKGPDVLSATLTGLKPATKYEAQVAARNGVGLGPWSTTASATTASAPAAPTALALTGKVRAITATWKAPASSLTISGYVVRITPAGGETVELTATGTSIELTGLAHATAYTVEVAAENAVGRGPYASADGTTLPQPPVPDTSITSGPEDGAWVATQSVSFGFTGSPSGAAVRFECKLGAAPYATCASPLNLSGLAEGAHTLLVRAVDGEDRADATPAQRTFTVDMTAPETTITSGPQATTTERSATFAYGSPAADAAGYECKLDGQNWQACTAGGKVYTTIGFGKHTFSVRAVDAAGNTDPTPAVWEWSVVVESSTPQAPSTPAPTPTPVPADPVTADHEALVSGLAALPGTARATKTAKSVSFALPAGGFPAQTRLTFALRAGGRKIGSGAYTVRTGAVARVAIKLTRKARRTLKRKRRWKASLSAKAIAPSGATAVRTRSVTLKLR